jgi:hypothetical protein
MIKVALTCAALLIAFAGLRPASAAEGMCYSCCNGLTAGGTCISLCVGVCPPIHQTIVMKTKKRCDAQYRTLACSGPRCTWVCSSTPH